MDMLTRLITGMSRQVDSDSESLSGTYYSSTTECHTDDESIESESVFGHDLGDDMPYPDNEDNALSSPDLMANSEPVQDAGAIASSSSHEPSDGAAAAAPATRERDDDGDSSLPLSKRPCAGLNEVLEHSKDLIPPDVYQALMDARDNDHPDCALCISKVQMPVTTHPCSHTYCLECIGTMVLNKPSSTISCPNCRGRIDMLLLPSERSVYVKQCHPTGFNADQKDIMQRLKWACRLSLKHTKPMVSTSSFRQAYRTFTNKADFEKLKVLQGKLDKCQSEYNQVETTYRKKKDALAKLKDAVRTLKKKIA